MDKNTKHARILMDSYSHFAKSCGEVVESFICCTSHLAKYILGIGILFVPRRKPCLTPVSV